jgi:signal transduction histidine kinase
LIGANHYSLNMKAELLRHAMLLTALGGAGLAAFVSRRARTAPGAGPLAAFLLLVGVWSLGLLYPGAWGEAALASAPAAAAVFVLFAARLTGRGSRLVPWAFALGGASTAAALILGAGSRLPWPDAGTLFRYEGAGLIAAGVTVVLAGGGHWLLLSAWRMAHGLERRRISTVLAASLLGLGSVAGLSFPIIGVDAFPWPLLLTPVYLALLAYGVLRHELLADQERLREAAERARLAELGALAATVAHDLRNPLNIIAMAAAGCDPEIRKEVRAQIARMEALARDLLDYAKPWRVEPSMVDVGAAARDATQGADVDIEVPAGLVVWADPLRLHQALVNLIGNAQAAGGRTLITAEALPGAFPVLIASERGSRSLFGRIFATQSGIHFAGKCSSGVAIHVCDNGAGVPEAIRETLFKPFVSRGANGTGLGLAIVAKVMEAHGGGVSLTKRQGWTTCFTLRFR